MIKDLPLRTPIDVPPHKFREYVNKLSEVVMLGYSIERICGSNDQRVEVKSFVSDHMPPSAPYEVAIVRTTCGDEEAESLKFLAAELYNKGRIKDSEDS